MYHPELVRKLYFLERQKNMYTENIDTLTTGLANITKNITEMIGQFTSQLQQYVNECRQMEDFNLTDAELDVCIASVHTIKDLHKVVSTIIYNKLNYPQWTLIELSFNSKTYAYTFIDDDENTFIVY